MTHEHFWVYVRRRGKQVLWRCKVQKGQPPCKATRTTYDKRVRPKK